MVQTRPFGSAASPPSQYICGIFSFANIRRGVKQGDLLSPFLFNLVVDELLNELNSGRDGGTLPGSRVSFVAFADDLVVLDDSLRGGKNMFGKVETFFVRGISMKLIESSSQSALRVPVCVLFPVSFALAARVSTRIDLSTALLIFFNSWFVISIRDNASAITLSVPFIYLMSKSYSSKTKRNFVNRLDGFVIPNK